jgi:hypothetical protein
MTRFAITLVALLLPGIALAQADPGVVYGNYNSSPPAACTTDGDIHVDLDSGAVFPCTDAATEEFTRVSAWSPLRFWVDSENYLTLGTTDCFNYAESDWTTGGGKTCTSTAGVLESAALFPPGVDVFAARLACAAGGSSVSGTLELDVRWRKGDAPGTQTDSVASLSIPAASFNSTIQSATINSACPYGAQGCMLSVHVKTALSGGSGINLSCDLLHATF